MNVQDYINQHTDINYCEAIIYPDGSIEDARPSHLEKLIQISNKPREILIQEMPISAGPVDWLVDYNNCCSIWFEMGKLPENVTDEQIDTIKVLKGHGIISKYFKATQSFEKKICEANDNYEKYTEEELNDIYNSRCIIDDFDR